MTFIVVTLAMAFLNGKYENVFKMDFRPGGDSKVAELVKNGPKKADSLKAASQAQIPGKPQNSNAAAQNQTLSQLARDQKGSMLPGARANTEAQVQKNAQETARRLKERQDSTYKSWLKSTVKLFNAMDPKKAAQILTHYSDNVARDIIYTMKKKNAAEILSDLDNKTAAKLTGARHGM